MVDPYSGDEDSNTQAGRKSMKAQGLWHITETRELPIRSA